ncbi:PREDICTED: uncharacterized protein LOC108366130 [Rhagoletis zephyria]|uniref:uncharacterized protein LOC108366130 n=1 Tax=Rhagoletis zephyria TaxID=28612 RepID=UPI0008112105|nr:PREDICTED: uncharacterized protein LOC108366130 [Rhagoletis zephyria]
MRCFAMTQFFDQPREQSSVAVTFWCCRWCRWSRNVMRMRVWMLISSLRSITDSAAFITRKAMLFLISLFIAIASRNALSREPNSKSTSSSLKPYPSTARL